jgi:hypothetical protein
LIRNSVRWEKKPGIGIAKGGNSHFSPDSAPQVGIAGSFVAKPCTGVLP